MFEKEAEEYANNNSGIRSLPIHEAYARGLEEGFQDGAEFAYNKANEWHYVKDGDYPKDNKSVLCILGDSDLNNCEVGYYNDVGSGEPWHFETYHLPDDDGDNAWGVSAWKEIVLPRPTGVKNIGAKLNRSRSNYV